MMPVAKEEAKALRSANEYLKQILLSPVYDIAVETPLQALPKLSKRLGQHVSLKREDLQPVHSFKLRGAYQKLQTLSEQQRQAGIIAASAGNHAQGVAMSAQAMGINATIVMPETTPDIKVGAVKRRGGHVVLHGKSFDEASKHAQILSAEKGMTFIPPYDDEDVIAGQGTVGRELLQQQQDMDVVFIPVGGGGLLAGISVYIKQLMPEIRIIAVESEDSACLKAAMDAGQEVDLDRVGLFADGVAVKRIGSEPFRLAQMYCDEVITVTSDEICAATKDIFEDCRAIAEPAGALALAGLKKYAADIDAEDRKLVAILSGANLNFDTLRYISERCELGEKKEAVLSVTIPEHKGSFRTFCDSLGRCAITEFNYRQSDEGPANIFVGIRLRDGQKELDGVMASLRENDYEHVDLSDNELAKSHVRYMIGGRAKGIARERILRFEFPEQPGALTTFLNTLGAHWDITLFHYRNHGAAFGQVLAGFELPEADELAFKRHLNALGYRYSDESDNPAFASFLA